MDNLIDDIRDLERSVIDTMTSTLESLNLTQAIRAQIDSGIKGSGAVLRPTYSQDPFFKSAEDAQEWITKYNKNISSSYPEWNLPARDTDTPNLNITGELFLNYITADVQGGDVVIQAIGSPIEADIRAKYGDDVLSLSPQVRGVIEDKLNTAIKETVNRYGFVWDVDV